MADTTVRCHSCATRAQRVQPKLGGVSPNGLQSPPESFFHSDVTNRLMRGYQVTRILTLINGSKNQIPGIWRNLKFGEIFFKELDRTRAARKLRNNSTSSPHRSWTFLLLGTLITMNPSLKKISLLLILETSSFLKRPVNDKTCQVILCNSAGLSS